MAAAYLDLLERCDSLARFSEKNWELDQASVAF